MASLDHRQYHSCNTGLSLGLSSFKHVATKQPPSLKFDQVLPALSLGPSDQGSSSHSNNNNNINSVEMEKVVNSVRRRTRSDDEDEDEEDDEEASPRKKLRLTKDQSALLEDIFKEHATLNPNQKQALAKQLNLRPRQVEVWFQNRRARTKLKQTEMDCELLKKCCERLTKENKRLQKELLELKSLKIATAAAPLYMPMPAATLSLCPSCEISNGSVIKSAPRQRYPGHNQKPVFIPTSINAGSKPPQFFPHSSALC